MSNYIKVDKQDIQSLKNFLKNEVEHRYILNYINAYISPEPFVKKMNKITARYGTVEEKEINKIMKDIVISKKEGARGDALKELLRMKYGESEKATTKKSSSAKKHKSVCCNAKIKWTSGTPDFPGDKVGITQSAFCTNCLRPCDIKI
jgi:hypothetical protein